MSLSAPVVTSRGSLRMICAERVRGSVIKLEVSLNRSNSSLDMYRSEKYLGCKQRFQNAVDDTIGLDPGSS